MGPRMGMHTPGRSEACWRLFARGHQADTFLYGPRIKRNGWKHGVYCTMGYYPCVFIVNLDIYRFTKSSYVFIWFQIVLVRSKSILTTSNTFKMYLNDVSAFLSFRVQFIFRACFCGVGNLGFWEFDNLLLW